MGEAATEVGEDGGLGEARAKGGGWGGFGGDVGGSTCKEGGEDLVERVDMGARVATEGRATW